MGLITYLNQYPIKFGVSQPPLFKSLKSSLGPTLWGCAFELTRGYQAGFDVICNGQRKKANHICAYTPKKLV